jgi:hypothetical protein
MLSRARFATAILVAAVAVIGVGLPAPAHASADDDVFIDTLDKYGMQYGDRAQAILAAKVDVCDQLKADPDETMADVVSTLRENTNWSDDDSAFFAGAAVGIYCPQYQNLANPTEPANPPPPPDGTDV